MACLLATIAREAEAVDESRFVLCHVPFGEDRTCNKTFVGLSGEALLWAKNVLEI